MTQESRDAERRAKALKLSDAMVESDTKHGIELLAVLYPELRAASPLPAPTQEAETPREPETWKDARGYVLPPYIAVIAREDGSVILEGHTTQHDWELETDAAGSVLSFTITPRVSSGSGTEETGP